MGWFDHTNPGLALFSNDLIAKRVHPRPMHFRTEMVLGVVTVVEPDQIVALVVTAHAPGDWFARIAAVMTVIAVQIGKAVAKVPKWQQETDVVPVQNAEGNQCAYEKRKFGYA